MTAVKQSNPKDMVGSSKVSLSCVPAQVMLEVAVGLYEGYRKYGGYNFRVIPIRASIYYDACMRHLMSWQEGQDVDPDSKLSHITKAIAGLVILRDAMMNDVLIDDRPPKSKNVDEMLNDLNEATAKLITKHPECKKAYTGAK